MVTLTAHENTTGLILSTTSDHLYSNGYSQILDLWIPNSDNHSTPKSILTCYRTCRLSPAKKASSDYRRYPTESLSPTQRYCFQHDILHLKVKLLHTGLNDSERIKLVKRFNDPTNSLTILIIMHQVSAQGIKLD